MDTDKKGYIEQMQLINFLQKSKRNLKLTRNELQDEVGKIFTIVDTDRTKKLSADEFIAVYTNIYYPQR